MRKNICNNIVCTVWHLGQVTLVFSDRVADRFSLLDFVTIQNTYNYSTGHPALTYLAITTPTPVLASPSDGSGRTMLVTLTSVDLNALKLNSLLIKSAPNIYLTVRYNLTQTVDGSGVVPFLPTVAVEQRTALKIREFTADDTAPSCLFFGLDLSQGWPNLHLSHFKTVYAWYVYVCTYVCMYVCMYVLMLLLQDLNFVSMYVFMYV